MPTKRIDFLLSDHLAHDLHCGADLLQGLCEINDINPISLFEDETFHLRVPTMGLVPEMGARFEQLLNGYSCYAVACAVCQNFPLKIFVVF